MSKSIVFALTLACSTLPAAGQKPRIIGGEEVTAGDYPWMVGLLSRDGGTVFESQDCGGTLVHPYWVVTAAHCVDFREASEIQVVIGATDLDAAEHEIHDVAEVIVHPGYRSYGEENDIALLLLTEPVDSVTPVEIINDPALAAPGVLGQALGWGALDSTDDPEFPTVLNRVELPILDTSVANQADWLNGGVTANMFAAGYAEGGKDTCGGDSGGPFVVRGPAGQWMLAGVINWGEGCAQPNKPGVYCRVSRYRQWLQSVIWPGFAKWESAAGITTDDGPDVDGDGASQWVEYAYRRNPRVADATVLLPGFTTFNTQRHATLGVKRPAGGGDITWGLQGSTNLSDWTPLDPVAQATGAAQAVPGDTGAEQITWRGLPEQNGRSFLRASTRPSGAYVPHARSLAYPGFARHSFHTLEPAGAGGFYQRDYPVTGLVTGQSTILTLRSGDFDAVLRLINTATGAVISSSTTNTAGGNDEKITFTPAAGASYTARVITQSAGELGDYVLAAFANPSGTTTIAAGTTRNGSLAITDQLDNFYPEDTYYKDDYLFQPASSSVFTLILSSSTVTPDLTAIDAETGEPLDGSPGIAGSGGALLTWKPVAGHYYFIRASSYVPLETGSYSLRGIATPTLAIGSSTSGSLTANDGLDPYYVIQGPEAYYADDFVVTGGIAGAPVTVTASSSAIDPTVEVINIETGATIAYDYQSGSVDFTPEAGNTYIVRVSSYAQLETGAYTLSLSQN